MKKFFDYRTKIEIDEVEDNLRKQFNNLSDKNEKLIEKISIDIAKKLNEDNAKKFNDISVRIEASRGLIWHNLGNLQFEKKGYAKALEYYFYAFDSYFYGKDEWNMQVIMGSIKDIYSSIKDLSLLKQIEKNQPNLMEKVNTINENNRYSQLINEMEEALSNLKQRLEGDKN